MKIHTYSFKIVPGPIPLNDFFAFLLQDDKNSYFYNSYKRIIHTKVDNNICCGIIISPKDQKTYLAIQQQGEKIKIKITEVDEGSQLCDFNMYIINTEKKRGVYTHYHGGMNLDTLQGYFNLYYTRCKRKTVLKDRALELTAQGIDPSEIDSILAEECKGDIAVLPIYRQDDILTLIQNMSEIRSITLTTLNQENIIGSEVPFSKDELEYITFKWKVRGDKVGSPGDKEKLLGLLRSNNLEDGIVRGRKAGEPIQDMPFKFEPVSHEDLDYDQALQDFEIEPNQFETTKIFQHAQAIARKIGIYDAPVA